MASRTVQFLAIFFMGLSLIPSGAHLLALPNKLGLERDAYFAAQQVYAGWAFLGALWLIALALNAVLTIGLRGQQPAFRFAMTGLLCVVAALIVFFASTFPANQATGNWTEAPANWEQLRSAWEYSHGLIAIIMLVGFSAVILACVNAES